MNEKFTGLAGILEAGNVRSRKENNIEMSIYLANLTPERKWLE
jgi:hypothetical protein